MFRICTIKHCKDVGPRLLNSEPCKHRCWLYICEFSIQKVCMVSLLHIYNFRVTCASLKLVSLQMHIWWVRCKQTWDTSDKVYGHYVMALECLCGPLPPQVFSPHHGPKEITESPTPFHINSCHSLMGGSLGADTSLTDWNVQEISSILLTKCCCCGCSFYVSRTKTCRALTTRMSSECILRLCLMVLCVKSGKSYCVYLPVKRIL